MTTRQCKLCLETDEVKRCQDCLYDFCCQDHHEQHKKEDNCHQRRSRAISFLTRRPRRPVSPF